MRNARLVFALVLTFAVLSTAACTNPTGPAPSQDIQVSKI